MPSELLLRCRCGRVRGTAQPVSPRDGLHLVCYCRDCRAFARFLEKADILDAAGGTDIFQMPPARLRFDAGSDVLRCMRLSEKGILRWYTDCCRTPIGNTVGPRIPIVGVVNSILGDAVDGRSRDEVLGRRLCRVHERSAVGPLPPSAPPPPSVRLFVPRAFMMLGWWMRGLARPSPFFDERTGAPRVEPRVLTQDERAAL